jgi:hypothetical protein
MKMGDDRLYSWARLYAKLSGTSRKIEPSTLNTKPRVYSALRGTYHCSLRSDLTTRGRWTIPGRFAPCGLE